MNIERIFRNLVLADFLSLILIIINFAVDGSYSNNNNVKIFPDAILPEPLILRISFGYIIIHPIILFLLYRFNSFGKLAYLPLIIILLVITTLSGTTSLSGPNRSILCVRNDAFWCYNYNVIFY